MTPKVSKVLRSLVFSPFQASTGRTTLPAKELSRPCTPRLERNTQSCKTWGFPKMVGFPPKSSHFNRVFHDFHHPFWGTNIFGNTHIESLVNEHSWLEYHTSHVQNWNTSSIRVHFPSSYVGLPECRVYDKPSLDEDFGYRQNQAGKRFVICQFHLCERTMSHDPRCPHFKDLDLQLHFYRGYSMFRPWDTIWIPHLLK